MGGTIENVRYERYKNSKKYKAIQRKIKKCTSCRHHDKGYCTNFNMRPSTLELANKCKAFETRTQYNNKLKRIERSKKKREKREGKTL